MEKLREKVNKYFIERDILKSQLSQTKEDYEKFTIQYNNALKARAILQMIAEKVQDNLRDHFSKLVSMALESVFDDPYKFLVHFEKKRGKTECKFILKRNGNEIDPFSCGGGVLDIACFALRIAFLIISSNRRIVILDEPFKNLRSTLHESAGLMVKHLSDELNIQFIIITHLDEMIKTGDRVIEIENINGISRISEVIENDFI